MIPSDLMASYIRISFLLRRGENILILARVSQSGGFSSSLGRLAGEGFLAFPGSEMGPGGVIVSLDPGYLALGAIDISLYMNLPFRLHDPPPHVQPSGFVLPGGISFPGGDDHRPGVGCRKVF